MKRSSAVHLVLLASAAVALEGCGNRQCVDEHNIVVDDRNCRTSSAGYHYYHVGGGSFVPIGSSVDAPGTTRGVFGAAGESASHGGGGSGGDGGGGGE